LIGLAQLAAWIPHYITWPFFVDHDVFATMARGWDAGRLPYRDCLGNNFPGTVYLFWVVGKVFGWGRTAPLFAVDAGLVLMLGGALLVWSRRRFGRILPGAVGYAAFLSYYLGLDFTLVAQRDWHGPVLAVLGLLAIEAYPSRGGALLSSLLFAAAFVVRPQVVLLVPAAMVAIGQGGLSRGESWRFAASRIVAWCALTALIAAVLFGPILAAGVWDDFVRGIRLSSPGGRYSQFTILGVVRQVLMQALHLESVAVPSLLVLLAPAADTEGRRSARVWLVALAGAWLYKPLSPVPWPYLEHPLALIVAIGVSVVVHLVLSQARATPSLRLACVVLMMLAAGVTIRPPYCTLGESLRALRHPARHEPADAPLGYLGWIRSLDDETQEPYPWADYRAVLAYLRNEVQPQTRVANLLRVAPALTGPSGRLSGLPAESLAWLVVDPDAESSFRDAVQSPHADLLVVWAPFEADLDDRYQLAPAVRRLAPIIRRYFEPAARFGAIEVWRPIGRSASTLSLSPEPTGTSRSADQTRTWPISSKCEIRSRPMALDR
jgi:hypothetical protein